MTQTLQKKNIINPIVAGITGVVAGAAAATAAMVMSDKGNQKKAKEMLANTKEAVVDYVDSVKSQPVVVKTAKEIGKIVKNV